MNEVIKNLIERRSINKFKDKQVNKDDLELILKAGTYAPTGMNRQSPVMVAVQDKETRDLISELNRKIMGVDFDPFYGAPTVVVVFGGRGVSSVTYVEDASLVMGNLMNAAFSLGVDSRWIHRAKEVFETEEGKALMKKWGLEGDYVGVGNCILGYRDIELPVPSARKENYIIRV